MHTLQHIAVKAVSKEQAFAIVQSRFETMYSESEGLGGWSDWYVIGGGRWNSDSSNQYKDSSNDVIAYSDDSNKYNEIVTNALGYRSEEMGRIKERLELDKFGSLIDMFIENKGVLSDEDRFDMTSYYVRAAASMLNGYWNQDSYFYDVENHSTSPKYMRDDLDKGNHNWYLVPVDFHF